MNFSLPCMHRIKTVENIIRGRSRGVARGPPLSPPPHLFFDQTEARRAEKNFTPAPPPLSQDLDAPPPPRPLIWRYGSATDNLQQLKLSVVWF